MANTKIPSELIADSSITAAKLADGTITTADIADSNVTTAKIADSNVTTAKIGDAQVTTAKITDANVTTGKIADDAVTTAKMASNSVTSDTIASGITLAGNTTFSGSVITSTLASPDGTGIISLPNTGEASFARGAVFNENSHDSDFRVESNANTHMLFVDAGNNRVGINSASPSEALQVIGNIGLYGELKLVQAIRHANSGAQVIDNDNDTYFILNDPEGANRIKLGDSGDAANTYRNTTHKFEPASGTEYMRINATGVGIGTTSPAGPLHVDGHTGSLATILEGNGNGDTVPLHFRVKANNNDVTNHGIFGNAGSTGAGNFIQIGASNTSGISVMSTGNVGIGTASPAAKLDVVGGHLRLDAGMSLQWDNSHERIEQSDGHLEFFVNNGETMTLDTNGLGIGTTAPNSKLHIGSGTNTAVTVGSQATPAFQIGGTNNYRLGMYTDNETGYIENKNGDDGIAFRVKTAGEVMRVTSAGNVHLNSGLDARVQLGTSGTGATSVSDNSVYIRGNDDDLILGAAGNGNISFKENADTRMFIKAGGMVGVGTSSPLRDFDVRRSLSIFGTGGYTELMLRGRAGTAQNLGAFHWSIRGDVGGNNDDLKLLRFTGGNSPSYAGIAMHIRNDNGFVGIGPNTGQATYPLEVQHNTNTHGIKITGGTSAANNSLVLNNTATNGVAWDITSTGGGHGYGNGDLNFGIGFGVPKVQIKNSGNVGIGNFGTGTGPQSLLHVQGTNNSAGDLYTAVGVGNCPGISIGNTGTTDNNNAALYFRNDGGERASIGARFVSHSNEKTELRFSTTNGSGATRERVKINGDGVIIATSTVSGSAAVNHFEISKTFSATGNSVTKHEINLINEIGATTAGNLHYQVSVGGYGSGGSNGVNATYSVAGYSGHSWSASNHGSMGAGTIQNGYKSSNSTSYDAKGLSYHPAINMGSYIQSGEVYAYSPGGQRYGFTISNNSSTAIAICITVRGWYR